MIFWITHILAWAVLLLELYLLAVKRSGDPGRSSDGGTLRIVWVLIGCGCLAGFLLAPRLTFFRWPNKLVIVLVADLLMSAGILLRVAAILHLGKYFTVDVNIQEGQRLIQDGPYRFVRHPSYSGSVLAFVGLACLTFNWLGFIAIIACSLVAYTLRISVEEKVLLENFGDEYRRYAERTKRLIPGVF